MPTDPKSKTILYPKRGDPLLWRVGPGHIAHRELEGIAQNVSAVIWEYLTDSYRLYNSLFPARFHLLSTIHHTMLTPQHHGQPCPPLVNQSLILIQLNPSAPHTTELAGADLIRCFMRKRSSVLF